MPVSLYYGEEQYLLSRTVRQLRSSVVNADLGGLSHRTLDNPRIYEVSEALGAVFFNLGGTSLIEIHNFTWLNKTPSDKAEEKQLDDLKELISTLDASKHALFVSAKVNKKFKFPKWLASQNFVDVKEFKPLNFWQTDETVNLLLQEAKLLDINISRPAAHTLVEHFGTSLQPLVNEIQKLATYAHGRVITPQDVMTLSNHDENAFQMLANWVKSTKQGDTFKVLDEILLKQHPVQLFALMQTYLNNIFQLKYMQHRGYNPTQMAEQTKKHPFRIKKDLEEFSGVPLKRLLTLKEQAIQLEWQAKTGMLEARLALETLLSQ